MCYTDRFHCIIMLLFVIISNSNIFCPVGQAIVLFICPILWDKYFIILLFLVIQIHNNPLTVTIRVYTSFTGAHSWILCTVSYNVMKIKNLMIFRRILKTTSTNSSENVLTKEKGSRRKKTKKKRRKMTRKKRRKMTRKKTRKMTKTTQIEDLYRKMTSVRER